MKKLMISACILMLSGALCFAQELCTGQVIDSGTGSAIPWATVKNINTKTVTTTDRLGRFSIKAKTSTDSIHISSTGYTPLKCESGTDLRILLHPALTSLTEVIVSASRQEQSRTEVPLAIAKVDQQTIKETKATTLYQVLNKVSGVQMVDLGNEQHTMAIRQPVSYNALYLYMEDGVPIRPTGIFNHNALYEINMSGLKGIEVIKGPASSLYGSNAIGGAINFITQTGSSGVEPQLSVQGDKYQYFRAEGSGGAKLGKTSLFAGGYIAHQDKGWQDYTGFNKYSGTIKGAYDLNPSTRLSLSSSYNYLYTQTPGSLDSIKFYSRSYASNQRFTYREVKSLRANTRLDHNWSSSSSTFFTAFFRDNSTGQLPSYYISDIRNAAKEYIGSSGQENNQSFRSYGALLQHSISSRFLNSRFIGGLYLDNSPSSFYANYLTISKDAFRNYYTSYSPTDSLLDNYRINLLNTAAFAQYEIHPLTKLRVVMGIRYDNVSYNFKNRLPAEKTKYKAAEENSFNVVAPKLGATLDLGKGRGLYSNFSIGFQPPETNTLYSSRQTSQLEEATFYNYELGGWVHSGQNLNIELSLYYMQGKNEIISVLMDDNTTENQNAASTLHSGIEYNVLYKAGRSIQVRLSGTVAKHIYKEYSEVTFGKTISYNNQDMPNAPVLVGNSEISWKPESLKGFRTMLEWQKISRYYVNSSNTKSYKGYDILNLRTGYEFSQGKARGLGLWLNCLNLSNRLYATTVTANQYGTTYNAAAPRTFTLGCSYTFKKHED